MFFYKNPNERVVVLRRRFFNKWTIIPLILVIAYVVIFYIIPFSRRPLVPLTYRECLGARRDYVRPSPATRSCAFTVPSSDEEIFWECQEQRGTIDIAAEPGGTRFCTLGFAEQENFDAASEDCRTISNAAFRVLCRFGLLWLR
ncbi:MAG: hypothetical protein AAB539_02195 [Patescibacteria group bacterium]